MRVLRLVSLGLVAALPVIAAADPPGEIAPLAPAAGADVLTEDVTFIAGNATDLDSVVLFLAVEVWSDLLGNVAFAGTVTQTTGGETTLVLDDVLTADLQDGDDPLNALDADLTDDGTYFWRGRAVDTAGNAGPWSVLRPFFYDPLNDAPAAGTVITPLDGQTVATLQPGLVVNSPTDPDDTGLTVRFDVTTDPDFGIIEHTSGDLPAGDSTTSWLVGVPLQDGDLYHWRTVVSDGTTIVAAPSGIFRINLGNDPPTPAIAVAPLDGADIAETSPVLTAEGVGDADGDAFQYFFEIDRTPTFSSGELQASGPIAAGEPYATWTPQNALGENVTYWWRVEGRDATSSGEAALSSFRVNAVNDPPSAPLVIDPAPDEVVLGSLGQVAFVPGADPEGTAVSWVVTVIEGDAGAEVATATGSASPGPVTVAVFDEPIPPGSYTLRVAVSDAQGLSSAVVSSAVRVRSFPSASGGAGGCATAGPHGGGPASLLGLAALVALACFVRRPAIRR